ETQGPVTKEDIAMARSYAALIAPFGQTELAFVAANDDRTQYMMEFLDKGATLESWKRMVTLNILSAPEDQSRRLDMASAYISHFRKSILDASQDGLKSELKKFGGVALTQSEDNGKTTVPLNAFYHFALGTGAAGEQEDN